MRIGAALTPEPGPAHDWLARELARPEYQPTPLERFSHWVQGLLDRVAEATAGSTGPGPLVALVLLVVLVGLVVLVLTRLQGSGVAPRGPAEVFADGRLLASEHRELARGALAEGRWDEAVLESVRALAAGLVEREVLADQPGATAHEIAEQSARRFPALAERLDAAARLFDETMYGDRPADESRAREVASLEETVRRSTPTATPTSGTVSAVPR